MSQKRKRTEQVEGEHHAQAPRKKKPYIPGKGHPKFKSRKPDPDAEPKGPSMSELKSRIRDLKRLLEHVDNVPKHKMPANVRIERERELATCQHELAERSATAQEAERRRKMISKYHHIRFFDRQKATRNLKKLQRQLSALNSTEESEHAEQKRAELQRQIHDAEVAVNYAIYYPLMKPYSALFGRTKQDKGDTGKEGDGEEMEEQRQDPKNKSPKGDPTMWAAVERAMAEGTLDALRNSDDGSAARKIKVTQDSKDKAKEKKKAQSKQKIQNTTPHEDEEESDGGFFE